MKKPLTVIIVSLFTLKGMSGQSIQRIKAMLLYIVYSILFVNTVDMKIKACNALNTMFVKTVDTLVFVALTQHLIQNKYYEVWKLCSTLYKVASHPSIQNTSTCFLPITFLIFNQFLESWDWGLFNHTIVTIYVNTVNTGQGPLMLSMLSMLTLSIQNT